LRNSCWRAARLRRLNSAINGNTNTQSALNDQISQLQAALTLKSQALTTQYDQVNAELEELPLLESQVSSQLASLKSSS